MNIFLQMTKNFVVPMLPCFFYNHSFSQPYESLFGEQNTSWNIYREIWDAGFTDSLVSGNDTVINSNTYKIIFDKWGYKMGFYREDTLLGKAWYIDKFEMTEFPVMDLSLSVNDTFDFWEYNTSVKTKKVDSVYTQNGKKHIRFELDSGFSEFPLVYDTLYPYDTPIEFIEGIGPNIGFTFQGGNQSKLSQALLCVSRDGQSIYQKYSFCRYDWVGISENHNAENLFSIYPNPNDGSFTIYNSSSENYSLYIYNVLGELVVSIVEPKVYSDKVTSDNTHTLNPNLSDGIYFLKLYGDGKTNTSPLIQKLIVNR